MLGERGLFPIRRGTFTADVTNGFAVNSEINPLAGSHNWHALNTLALSLACHSVTRTVSIVSTRAGKLPL